MKNRTLWTSLFALSMGLTCVTPALAEEAAEAPAPQIVDAEVITYTTDQARSVAGVRIEYDQDIMTGTYSPDSYYVNGYDNSAVYVSESGEFKDASVSGKYVFVEFALSQKPGYKEGKIDFWTDDNTYTEMTLDIFCPDNNCWFKTTDSINYEADDYLAGSVTSEDGTETLYRLYVPEGYDKADESLENLPLVIWLHGSGESGTDNEETLVGNRGALNFSSKESQAKHPCFVLVPQTTIGWKDGALENVDTMVKNLIAEYNVDASRIYAIGCSMGGMGTRRLAETYPDMLAAAVPIAIDGYKDMLEENEDRTLYEGLPMIYIAAANDAAFTDEEMGEEGTIEYQFGLAMEDFEKLGMKTYSGIGEDALNGWLRGDLATMEMQDVLDGAQEAGADKIFVTYLAGTVSPSHSSWMAATANSAIHDWMFAQVNDAPYAAE